MTVPASRTPYPLCVLGSQAAGKSCFLAGLTLLGDASTDSGVQILGAAGTDTQRWLSEFKTALRGGRWPPSTTDTRLFLFDLKVGDTVFDAAMVDYPGESFQEAMNTLTPDQFEDAQEHIRACKVLLLLLDPEVELDAAPATHPDVAEHRYRRVDALLNAVFDQIRDHTDRDLDIAFVITKADRLQTDYAPKRARALVKKRLPVLYRKVVDLAPNAGNEVPCFFISAVGGVKADTEGHPQPARPPAPQGYDTLLRWITERKHFRETRRARTWRWRLVGAAALLILAVGSGGFLYHHWWLSRIGDKQAPLSKRTEAIQALGKLPFGTVASKEAIDRFMRESLDAVNEDIESATCLDDFARPETMLKELAGIPHHAYGKALREADERLRERQETFLFERVATAHRAGRWTEVLEGATHYMKSLPGGPRREAVVALQVEAHDRLGESRRADIGIITLPVDRPGEWRDFLRRKADAVNQYAKDHAPPILRAELIRAVEKTRLLAEKQQFKGEIESASAFKDGVYDSRVVIKRFVDGKKSTAVHTTEDKEGGRQPTWKEDFTIPWKAGDRYALEWRDGRVVLKPGTWGQSWTIARKEDVAPTLFALRLFTGPVALDVNAAWAAYLQDGQATLNIQLEDFSDEDWELLERYIHPGGYWAP